MNTRAEGGGICISGSAYDHVKNKLPLGYEFLGNKELKNIAEPVPVYRVLTDPAYAGKLTFKCIKDSPRHKIMKRVIGVVIIFLLIFIGGTVFKMKTGMTPGEHRKMIKEKILSLRIPDKPSIAVLPFINMSGDKEQEYFSDGLTEDLITDLSKISGLFVIARNSVFAYKGQNVKVDKIGRELAVQMTSDDKKRIMTPKTSSIEAYDDYLKTKDLCNSKDLEEIKQGREMLQKVIATDPSFAKAYSDMGKTYFTQWIFGSDKDPAILNKVFEYGMKAIAINPDEPSGYSQLAHFYLWTKQHDSGIKEIKKAIALDPNNSEWLATYGELLTYANQPEEGIEYLLKAIRLDPKYPVWYLYGVGHAYWLIDDYDKAIAALEKAVEKDPGFWPPFLILALCYEYKGMTEESRQAAQKALALNPNLPTEDWEQIVPYKSPDAATKMIADLKRIGIYK